MPVPGNRINVIVNADDLGRTQRINEGIEEAFRHGILSSTSLVANSQDFFDAIKTAQRNPALGIGIHLTIHEYPPLTDIPFLEKMSKKSMIGAFSDLMLVTEKQVQVIKQEFRSQIDKILSAGVVPSHLDGHNHVHIHPRLFKSVLELAQEYSIPWVRLPNEGFVYFTHFYRYAQKVVLSSICSFNKSFHNPRVNLADHFHGFSYGGNIDERKLLYMLNKMRPGVNELMCHVGCDNDDPPYSIGYRWAQELKAMKMFTKDELKKKMGINIISYREIGQ